MENEFLNFLKFFQNFTSDDNVSKKDKNTKAEFEKYFPQLKRIRKIWVWFWGPAVGPFTFTYDRPLSPH